MGAKKARALNKSANSIKVAAVIQFGSKYVNVAVQMVITMVLARLLTPQEYGVMAVVTVFIGLFSIISNIGIGSAVVQYRELENEDFEALFTFTILLGVVLSILFAVLGIPVSLFYGNEEYVSLMTFAALSVFFQAANMVPNGLLIRNRMFLASGVRLVATSVLGGAVAVVLALSGWGVYALVVNTVLQSALNLIWNLAASSIRRLRFTMRGPLRLVGRFASFQFLAQVVQYFARNLDTILIGAVFGSTPLGYYDKAYKLAKYPIDFVPSTIQPVLKSFFATINEDKDKIYELYFKVEKALSLLGAFVSVLCFFSAEELVLLFFGSQWGDSVPIFQALSVSIVFQMVNFPAASVLESVKRTDYLLGLIGISAGLLLALMVVGLLSGSMVVCAWMISFGFILYTPFVWLFVVRKALGKSIVQHLKGFVPEIIGTVLAGLALAVLCRFLSLGLISSFVVKLLVAALIYGTAMVLMGQAKYIKMILGTRRNRAGA